MLRPRNRPRRIPTWQRGRAWIDLLGWLLVLALISVFVIGRRDQIEQAVLTVTGNAPFAVVAALALVALLAFAVAVTQALLRRVGSRGP